MQITMTMSDLKALTKTYLDDMGISTEGKKINYTIKAGRKNVNSTKIIIDILEGTKDVQTVSTNDITEDTEETVEQSDEEVVDKPKSSLFG